MTLSCLSFLQLFALLGFIVSAVLISAMASEVVSLLHMLGVVLSLSNTVLELTLLAWGIAGDINATLCPDINVSVPYRFQRCL